jgi:hypothetical protein
MASPVLTKSQFPHVILPGSCLLRSGHLTYYETWSPIGLDDACLTNTVTLTSKSAYPQPNRPHNIVILVSDSSRPLLDNSKLLSTPLFQDCTQAFARKAVPPTGQRGIVNLGGLPHLSP